MLSPMPRGYHGLYAAYGWIRSIRISLVFNKDVLLIRANIKKINLIDGRQGFEIDGCKTLVYFRLQG